MAKLNRTEVKALASKIGMELNDEAIKYNKELREKAEEKFYDSPLGKLVMELENEAPEMINNYAVSKFYTDGLPLKRVHSRNYGSSTFPEIEDEITLAQIECDNINEIIETVKAKFK